MAFYQDDTFQRNLTRRQAAMDAAGQNIMSGIQGLADAKTKRQAALLEQQKQGFENEAKLAGIYNDLIKSGADPLEASNAISGMRATSQLSTPQKEEPSLLSGLFKKEVEQDPSISGPSAKPKGLDFSKLYPGRKSLYQQEAENKKIEGEFGRKIKEKELGLKEKELEAAGFKITDDIRKEVTAHPATKDFQTVSSAVNKVAESYKAKTAAGDMGMIFGLMKVLDPGSTVREGEFATAQNTVGVPDKVRNLYNRALSGDLLSPSQRDDFYNVAVSQARAQEQNYNQAIAPIINRVQQGNVDRNLIFPQYQVPSSAVNKSGAPKITKENAAEVSKQLSTEELKTLLGK